MIQNRLEELLEKNDLSITELSKKIKISRNSISNLINNNVDLQSYKTDTLNKICSYFQIGIEDFLFITEEPVTIVNNEVPYITDDRLTDDFFAVLGSIQLKDRFDHLGQISYSLSFDFSPKANLLINDKKTKLAFVEYDLRNEESYDNFGLQTTTFTEKYFEAITNNMDNVQKILSKILDISLLEVKDHLPFNGESFALMLTGVSNDIKEKYHFTFFVDSSIYKSKLLSFEVSEF